MKKIVSFLFYLVLYLSLQHVALMKQIARMQLK